MLSLSSTDFALPLATSDGLLPFGDLATDAILIVGACIAHDNKIPTTKKLAELIFEADFKEYFKDRETNICSMYSFRRVARYPGGLKYMDDYCMNQVEAFLYVSLLEGDVYTASEDAALMLAAIMERDKASPTKDVTTFFFHYHAGIGRSNGAHIFFGLNDLGYGPT